MFFTHFLVEQESIWSICGYTAAYSKGGGRGHFSGYPGDHTCSFIQPQFTAPRFRSELKMAARCTKELALFIVCLHYEPTVELGTEKMRDAWNAPWNWGLHLDLMQLWSILAVRLSSLCRQHSRHTLLVCLHTILVSITINFYRGKLTNISLIIGFSRSKSYLKTSWPWLMESIPARVGFFPFRRAKRDVNNKNNQNNVQHPRTCKVQHASWDISLLSLLDEGLKHSIFSFFLNLGMVLKNSTPGKFTSIWLFKRAEIILKEFEKAQIRFNGGVFVAIASWRSWLSSSFAD